MTPKNLEEKARRILDPMRGPPVALSGYRQVEAGRAAALSHLAQLIESVPVERARHARTRHLRRGLGFVLAGGLVLAAASAVWLRVGASAMPATLVQPTTLQLVEGRLSTAGVPLSAGVSYAIGSLGRVSTSSARGARFITSEGLRVSLDSNSTADLLFSTRDRRVSLNHGRVELAVPKLAPGASLSVTTPDAVVTVHGTRFSVAIVDGQTCVEVSEGIVSVARGAEVERLSAGAASGCRREPVAPTEATPRVSSRTSQAEPVDVKYALREASRPRQTPTVTRASEPSDGAGTLTQENRLFERALAAEQAQRWREAETLCERLLARYPDSPMVPEARRVLERLRLRRATTGADR